MRFLTNKYLFLYSSFIVAGEALILAVWSGVDPLVPTPIKDTVANTFWYECTSKYSTAFTGVLLAYNALLLLSVVVLAYHTRNVYSAFRESAWIVQASSNITLASMVALVVLNVGDGSVSLKVRRVERER